MLPALAVLSFLYWVVVAIATFRMIRGVPLLERLAPPEPKTWPRVSVIVPACNEEASLEEAMRSRLAEGYPDAEYLLVDDRSTDRTGAIVDRLAKEDGRVRALHVCALPDGWLGKVHAMHVALGRATGEWILFSDADVHHEPGTLRRIVAHCEERQIDHVSVFPDVWSGSSFWHDVVMNAMVRMFSVFSRAWKVSDPRSRVSMGGGNFNLVRRSALDRIGGLEDLRLEVIDDLALAQKLKWSGARQEILNARGFVGLWFYRSVSEIIRGLEKNSFAAMGRFSLARFIIAITVLAAGELSVFPALVFGNGGDHGWVRIVAALSIVIAVGVHVVVMRWLHRPLLPSLLAPIGVTVMLGAAMRSMLLTLIRGGVDWRGTRYSLAALRRGMRYVYV